MTGSKMAIIGPHDVTQIFGAAGFDVFETMPTNLNDYAVVLTTEPHAGDMTKPYPIIMQIGEQQ